MNVRAFVFLVVGMALAGCGDKAAETREFAVNIDKSLTPQQVDKVRSAASSLFDKCTAMKEYLPDIVSNTAGIHDAAGFSEKGDFGWNEFVQFDFTISDKPRQIPAQYRAAGHHCLFRVSGDELAVQKTVCAQICKGEATTVDHTYSLYIGKAERAKTRENFESIRKKALQGDYQAQRNLAYGYSSFPYDGQDKNPILGCAWRMVIIKSGSERVDKTDSNNVMVYCDNLDPDSRKAAQAQSQSLMTKIRGGRQ